MGTDQVRHAVAGPVRASPAEEVGRELRRHASLAPTASTRPLMSCRAAAAARQKAQAMVLHAGGGAVVPKAGGSNEEYRPSAAVARRMPSKWPRPVWHAPWKLYRVIAGHLG